MVPLLSYSFCIDFFRSGIEYFLLMVQKVYRTLSRMIKNEIAQYFLLYLYYIFEHIFLFSLFKLFYIDDENIELGSFRNKKVLLIVSNTISFVISGCHWKRNKIISLSNFANVLNIHQPYMLQLKKELHIFFQNVHLVRKGHELYICKHGMFFFRILLLVVTGSKK